MFDFKVVGDMLAELKSALPGIRAAAPEVISRLENLETNMLALANRNIELLESIERSLAKMVQPNFKQ